MFIIKIVRANICAHSPVRIDDNAFRDSALLAHNRDMLCGVRHPTAAPAVLAQEYALIEYSALDDTTTLNIAVREKDRLKNDRSRPDDHSPGEHTALDPR